MPNVKAHISISERKLFLRILDVVTPIASFYIVSLFTDYQYFNFSGINSTYWIISLSIYLLFFGEIFEMYNLKIASDSYLTLRSTFLMVLFTTMFYIFTPYFSPILPQNRLQIIYFSIVIFSSIIGYRYIYIHFIHAPRFLKNILVIAEVDEVDRIIQNNYNSEVNRIGQYISNQPLASPNDLVFFNIQKIDLKEILKEHAINEIIVSNTDSFISKSLNEQLIRLFEKGVSIKSVDSFIEDETFKISEKRIPHNFYQYFSFSKSQQNNLYVAFHRIMDVLFSIIGLLFFGLLVPLVFIGNLIGNKGELFYSQERIGRKGKSFRIIKFRTMKPNSEQNGAVWAQKNDTRITKFGRFLRKTRVDEVPQFINILKGEMSLIGPRPERPEFVAMLNLQIPYYSIRHVIKPGLTGWAQVMHPYASSVSDQQEKLMYDLYYIKERTLLMDLKIVIKTISTVLFFRGT